MDERPVSSWVVRVGRGGGGSEGQPKDPSDVGPPSLARV